MYIHTLTYTYTYNMYRMIKTCIQKHLHLCKQLYEYQYQTRTRLPAGLRSTYFVVGESRGVGMVVRDAVGDASTWRLYVYVMLYVVCYIISYVILYYMVSCNTVCIIVLCALLHTSTIIIYYGEGGRESTCEETEVVETEAAVGLDRTYTILYYTITYTIIYIYIHTHTHTHICIYIYIHIYTYAYIYIYIYIHTFTSYHWTFIAIEWATMPPAAVGDASTEPGFAGITYLKYTYCYCNCVYCYYSVYSSLSLYIYIYIYIHTDICIFLCLSLSLSPYIYIYIYYHIYIYICLAGVTTIVFGDARGCHRALLPTGVVPTLVACTGRGEPASAGMVCDSDSLGSII